MLKKYDPANPELLLSAVCFADILGFSQLVLDAQAQGNGNALLKQLHHILTTEYKKLKPSADYVGILKSFTDNIVIGLPIHEDGESQLGSIFLGFADFQTALTLNGFFVRGGVSIGDYYGDDEFAYGPSIIEAHDLEANKAVYPRIILSADAVKLVKSHLEYYADPKWSPQFRDVLIDNTDGEWFINYLESVMSEVHDSGNLNLAVSELQKHKKAITNNLIKHQGNQRIYSKYQWAAEYHNYFCTLNFEAQFLQANDLLITQHGNGNFSTIA
ncbi:hypothetical protein [Domibacillus robiginosus]|uniref:hypothetical protein n=1 Tax=Domibacillus robiginosus TaxID=1071054 RepID=UPI00067B2212|nr:hypothetical protein [Domibacillus robiginosus]